MRLRHHRPLCAFVFLLTAASFSFSSFAAEVLNVMIDPGHGGKDHGACLAHAKESEITLAVAKKLESALQKDRRFRVFLSRQKDLFLSLSERTRQARQKNAAVFVSVHVNSSPDSKAKGAEFYFQNQLPPDEEAMFLAHQENLKETPENRSYEYVDRSGLEPEVGAIVTDLLDGDRIWKSSQLSRAMKKNWSGNKKSKTNSIRQAPFFVLNQLTIPSTLVELGFLTNPDDFRQLIDPSFQQKMADDLHLGLIEYLNQVHARGAGT